MLKQNTSTRLIYLIITFRPGTATPFGTFLPKNNKQNHNNQILPQNKYILSIDTKRIPSIPTIHNGYPIFQPLRDDTCKRDPVDWFIDQDLDDLWDFYNTATCN